MTKYKIELDTSHLATNRINVAKGEKFALEVKLARKGLPISLDETNIKVDGKSPDLIVDKSAIFVFDQAYENDVVMKIETLFDDAKFDLAVDVSESSLTYGYYPKDNEQDIGSETYPKMVKQGNDTWLMKIDSQTGSIVLEKSNMVCFEALETSTVKLTVPESATVQPTLVWAYDYKGEFTDFLLNTDYTLKAGEKMWIKCPIAEPEDASEPIRNTTFNGDSFVTSGKLKVSGNIMGLVDQIDSSVIPSNNCFKALFKGSSGIYDVSELELPATTLKQACYNTLFSNCLNLEKGTKLLPAINSANGCYQGMFENCRKMKTSPVIMLENVASTCCYVMFVDCWSMTSLSMPNQTGKSTGGSAMSNSMRSMIQNTGKIKYISVPSLETFGSCDQWIYMGTEKPNYPWPADGIFVCHSSLGTDETISRGVSACPVGWKVINV